MDDLKTRVTAILATKFNLGPAELADDPTLDELSFDSLAIVEFATALEKEFGTPIDEETISVDQTVSEVIDMIGGIFIKS